MTLFYVTAPLLCGIVNAAHVRDVDAYYRRLSLASECAWIVPGTLDLDA